MYIHWLFDNWCWTTSFLGKSANRGRYYQLFSWSPWYKVHIKHMVWYAPSSTFWDILSYLAKFRAKKCSEKWRFSKFSPKFGHFPFKTREIMLFSCRMKQKWTRKTNTTIFGLFIWPNIQMFHGGLKYVIFTDISGFEALPKVQNWLKIHWILVILLICVRKEVYFKKIFKIRILDKVWFSQMSSLWPTVHSGPTQQFQGHLVINWPKCMI